MKKIKSIAVVTGSRAEYGILKPLLKKMKSSKDIHLFLYVTGMHLLKKFGNTSSIIQKDGFTIHKKIPMYKETDKDGEIGIGLGRGIENFTKEFKNSNTDVVIVFGDRLESMAATLAAAILNIPIAHIHGGDKTDSGHIDEATRHSISKYSHIHFTPTKAGAKRLIQMGEQKFRVNMVGALGIDSILEIPSLSKKAVCDDLGLNSKQEVIVWSFLPLPNESKNMGKHAKEMPGAIKFLKKQCIIIYPNNDTGSDAIIREIEKLRNLPYITIVKSLPSEQYINLLRNADVLVGNSSSGIIEAPSLKLPVVNIGSRNIGREHAKNILFVDPKQAHIRQAIEKALYDKKFKSNVRKCKNPYGSGGTALKIINILKKTELNKKLMLKKVTY
jgi:GDP/UDP-N,N'-diacetylbacillosamine 2-epimerase (hydrolysing)